MGGGSSTAKAVSTEPRRLMLHSEHALALPGFERALLANSDAVVRGRSHMRRRRFGSSGCSTDCSAPRGR